MTIYIPIWAVYIIAFVVYTAAVFLVGKEFGKSNFYRMRYYSRREKVNKVENEEETAGVDENK